MELKNTIREDDGDSVLISIDYLMLLLQATGHNKYTSDVVTPT